MFTKLNIQKTIFDQLWNQCVKLIKHSFFYPPAPVVHCKEKKKTQVFFSSNTFGIKSFTETTCIQKYYTICSAEHKENNVNSVDQTSTVICRTE